MSTYVDYEFYTAHGTGTVPEQDFDRLAFEASRYLDRITFGRLKDVTDSETLEAVRYTCIAYIDRIYLSEQAEDGGKEIQSVSNQGYSVSYSTDGLGGSKTLSNRLNNIALIYLPPELLSYAIERKRGSHE